ncbi:nicotinate-nucleotide adenylyltransferase [Secundilactobacillus mixtipabuli]|uniref:Probable nicotinate-nucleotide adenylyltransferase n=1 Tax=Secundilactobacillus mixtipabuli TaxID=1435342 RepID=A0A1Z5I9F4_9LACO|nr:nicotinate-nucleotide adenylyltransferase [Secundilactobacillus mixtipabuli]GAW98379.1 nicotinic acid mononucleotide adenylyltransferase [Secundilactobacillus mixtipabuli]
MVKVVEQTATKVVEQLAATVSKKRIGILGGTFNPPHIGHLIVADQVMTQLGLDRVLFMPDANPPHVDRKVAIDAADRVKMVSDTIAGNPDFGIELAEVQRGGISYTYDTMLELKRKHPENDYYFIIGGDMVDYLPKWHRIDELVKLVQFVGVRREDYPVTSKYPVLWVDIPRIDISSSMIRSRIRQGQSIRYFVKDAVARYIKERQLYHE